MAGLEGWLWIFCTFTFLTPNANMYTYSAPTQPVSRSASQLLPYDLQSRRFGAPPRTLRIRVRHTSYTGAVHRA
jgi:hypothetical protein